MSGRLQSERLREKLTERGEEHETNDHMGVFETSWRGFTATQISANANLIMAVTPEQAIAATLGGGTLTAEQVREAIERHFGKVAVLDDGKPVEWRDDWVCKVAIDYRGIADELNAALGGGTCEWVLEHSGTLYDKWRCSECGYEYVESRTDSGATELDPNFCPKCGKAVKR